MVKIGSCIINLALIKKGVGVGGFQVKVRALGSHKQDKTRQVKTLPLEKSDKKISRSGPSGLYTFQH